MKKAALLLPFAALLMTGTVYAESGETLARKHKCAACHKVNQRAIGPTLQNIANKYADNPAAQAQMTERVRRGSEGVWGTAATMAPHPDVPDEELKLIIEYILAQKR